MMVTGIIKNKIDKIWTDIWAGGITNPLTVIEQLTYVSPCSTTGSHSAMKTS